MSLDKKVNWYEEELDHFYGHNNEGYVFGIYCYDGEDIIDVQWYKSEYMLQIKCPEYVRHITIFKSAIFQE